MPVFLLLSVLFLNTLFAILICVTTSLSYTEFVEVSETAGGKQVSLLELVRLRLISPFALIADRYGSVGDDMPDEGAEDVANTTGLDMFSEIGDVRQVRVGICENKVTGRKVFGTWMDDPAEEPGDDKLC